MVLVELGTVQEEIFSQNQKEVNFYTTTGQSTVR